MILPQMMMGLDISGDVSRQPISSHLQSIIHTLPDTVVRPFWVFFTDKGKVAYSAQLNKSTAANLSITPHALDRRATRGIQVQGISDYDLPVDPSYVQRILNISGEGSLRIKTRWLNGISIDGSARVIQEIAQLPFVREIEMVGQGYRREPDTRNLSREGLKRESVSGAELNYGNSYDQLQQIDVIAAHQAGYSGQGVRVLMLDTGFDKSHIAIDSTRIIAEHDFINNDGNTQNETPEEDAAGQDTHGTATTSTLGAAVDGELYGPAYRCQFLLAKTEYVPTETPIEEDWYVAGLEWGERQGADLVSSSLGYIDWYNFSDLDGQTAVTTRAVNIAIQMGVTVVTAAGNENGTDWGHIIAPADAPDAITVGAVDSDGRVASFSSRGPTYDGRIKPEVAALGVATVCARAHTGKSFTRYSGTSLATPLVAGVVALILEAHPYWNPLQVREALMQTAGNRKQPDNEVGWGVVDAYAAINYPVTSNDTTFQVTQNYPNPFNLRTYIKYSIPDSLYNGHPVALDIFNLRGERVAHFTEPQRAGIFNWNVTGKTSRAIPSGIYVYRVKSGKMHQSGKMILIR